MNKYDIFGHMDANKSMDFIVNFFDNMGMRETDLPLDCSYCPLKKECNQLEDTEMTCLEFLLTKLK